MSECSVEGCPRQVHGRGLCNAHHHRALRHGSPVGELPLAETRQDRRWLDEEHRWRREVIHLSRQGLSPMRIHIRTGHGLWSHVLPVLREAGLLGLEWVEAMRAYREDAGDE